MTAALTSNAVSQERQRVFFRASGENALYTKQHALDVPDMPGHKVRLYAVRRAFPTNPPMINGLAIKEIFTRGIADYTEDNGNGRSLRRIRDGK